MANVRALGPFLMQNKSSSELFGNWATSDGARGSGVVERKYNARHVVKVSPRCVRLPTIGTPGTLKPLNLPAAVQMQRQADNSSPPHHSFKKPCIASAFPPHYLINFPSMPLSFGYGKHAVRSIFALPVGADTVCTRRQATTLGNP